MIIELSEHKRIIVEETTFNDEQWVSIKTQYNTKKDKEWKYSPGGIMIRTSEVKKIKTLGKHLVGLSKEIKGRL